MPVALQKELQANGTTWDTVLFAFLQSKVKLFRKETFS